MDGALDAVLKVGVAQAWRASCFASTTGGAGVEVM